MTMSLEINMKLPIETLEQMHEHWLDYVDDIVSAIEVAKLMHPDDTVYHALNQVQQVATQLPYDWDTTYYVQHND